MLFVAAILQHIPGDKLFIYGLSILLIAALTLALKYGWSYWKYRDYRINLRKYKGQFQTKEMFGFAGWNLFGGLALMGRNQGVAVIINLFLGTIANAAYGIANQINGALCHFSSTFQKAINPQLMKSEGMGNRERLMKISYITSKFSVLAICLFAIPIIVEMPDVLRVWLKGDIPPYAIELSCCILLLSIVTQYSMGLMSAIQAVGKIRNYQFTIGLLILLNVPFAYVTLKMGLPVYFVTITYVIIEFISLFVRMAFAKNLVGLEPSSFFEQVVKPTLLVVIIPLLLCSIPHFLIHPLWSRLISTIVIYIVFYLTMMWFIALDKGQRDGVLLRLHYKKHK
jgi:O-antigen/teichoic acid export membrane protein